MDQNREDFKFSPRGFVNSPKNELAATVILWTYLTDQYHIFILMTTPGECAAPSFTSRENNQQLSSLTVSKFSYSYFVFLRKYAVELQNTWKNLKIMKKVDTVIRFK